MIIWKEFKSQKFWLDWRKFVLLAVIFTVTSMNQSRCDPGSYDLPGCGFNGFPLAYLQHGAIGYNPITVVDYLGLVVDVIFWFFVSAFTIWVFDMKTRKKKKKQYWGRHKEKENSG